MAGAPVHRLDSDDCRQRKTHLVMLGNCANVRWRAPVLAVSDRQRREVDRNEGGSPTAYAEDRHDLRVANNFLVTTFCPHRLRSARFFFQ